MKKLLFVAAVSAFIAVSCQKDRTCTCTTSYSSGGTSYTQDIIFKDASKSQAKAGCVSTAQTNTTTNVTTTNDCKLK